MNCYMKYEKSSFKWHDIPSEKELWRKLDFRASNDKETNISLTERSERIYRGLAKGRLDYIIWTSDYFWNSWYDDYVTSILENPMERSRSGDRCTSFVLVSRKWEYQDISADTLRSKTIATEMPTLAKKELIKKYWFESDDIVIISYKANPDTMKVNLEEKDEIIEEAKKEGKIIIVESNGSTEWTVIPYPDGTYDEDFCIEIKDTWTSIKECNLEVYEEFMRSGLEIFIRKTDIKNPEILAGSVKTFLGLQSVLNARKEEDLMSTKFIERLTAKVEIFFRNRFNIKQDRVELIDEYQNDIDFIRKNKNLQKYALFVPYDKLEEVEEVIRSVKYEFRYGGIDGFKEVVEGRYNNLTVKKLDSWEISFIYDKKDFEKIQFKLLALGCDNIRSIWGKTLLTQEGLGNLDETIFESRESINRILNLI